MKKYWKMLWSTFAVTLVFMACAVSVQAASVDDLEYAASGNGTITITGCNENASGSLTIPQTISGQTVTGIDMFAFSGCKGLTSVTIPDTVTTIDYAAFEYCESLKSVTLPKGLKEIAGSTFHDCFALTSIDLPGGLTTIKSNAFWACSSLAELTIPSTVKSIEINAFADCTALKSIVIPDSVTSLSGSSFPRCTSLENATIGRGIREIEYNTFGECSLLAKVTLTDSTTSIASGAFADCFNLKDVYFMGTQAEWLAMSVESDNTKFLSANIHYVENFTDVPIGQWYAESVNWALENGITNGTTPTTFSPDQTCTDAQILSFLWRAMGSPKASIANPFSNVKASDWYYDAALWAYEQGMISGSTFNANASCTRASTVVYLWIVAGKPSASGSSFNDVASNASYAQAVAWAVSKSITSGTSATTFSPDTICTRAQIVTFLQRDLAQ